eukprot:1181525-Prorocentrum_minimum.AAC.6
MTDPLRLVRISLPAPLLPPPPTDPLWLVCISLPAPLLASLLTPTAGAGAGGAGDALVAGGPGGRAARAGGGGGAAEENGQGARALPAGPRGAALLLAGARRASILLKERAAVGLKCIRACTIRACPIKACPIRARGSGYQPVGVDTCTHRPYNFEFFSDETVY